MRARPRAGVVATLAGGIAVAHALACGTGPAFSCEGDGDCTLAGVRGVCVDGGLCAYPDDACSTGFSYPDGTPSGQAGKCVDAGVGGTAESTSASAGGSESGAPGSEASSAAATTAAVDESDSTGTPGCVEGRDVDIDAVADAFFSNLTDCFVTSCDVLNHGATPNHGVRVENEGVESLLAVRFALRGLIPAGATITTARLFVSVRLDPDQRPEDSGLSAWPLSPIAWAEGTGDASVAIDKESNWIYAEVPRLEWGLAGPPNAIGGPSLGSSGPLKASATPVEIAITLDAEAVGAWLDSGADTLLLRGSSVTNGALTVHARESVDASPPRVQLGFCVPSGP